MHPPSQPNKIFFGDDGLRAGWSIAIFLAPFAALYLLVWLARYYHLVPATPPGAFTLTPALAIFGEGLPLLFIAFAAVVMSLIEHRPFSRYGLTLHRMLPDFAAGLCWGVLALSLLIGLLWASHAISIDGIALHTGPAFAYAFKWAFAFLLVGLLEEFCFRGYLQFTLARGISGIVRTLSPRNPYSHAIGFWIAAFILSGWIFAYTHTSNSGETFLGILAVACAGTVFVFSLWRTGSLWWAIGFHAAWDWSQSFLYGTPDSGGLIQGHLLATHPIGSKLLSGGSDGPEGSVLVFPVLLLAALIIHLTLPRRDYPLTPDQSAPPPPLPDERTPPHPQSTA